jgi:hypothetical protein
MFTIIKALLPFLQEAIFGKEDPLEVLNRNKTSSVLVVTVALLAVMVCGLFYSNVKLFNANAKVVAVVEPLKQEEAVVVAATTAAVAIDSSATDALILEHLQRLELKIMNLQELCKKALSNNTTAANSTDKQCE